MAKCRLKNNVIGSDGKFLKRGSLIDDQQLPSHMRTKEFVDYKDLSGREGQVLLLHGVIYTSDQFDHTTGQWVGYPITLAAGELITLEEAQHQGWVEGADFKSDWSPEDQYKVRQEQEALENELMFGKKTGIGIGTVKVR
jgi:hypothetical protein